MTSLRSFNNETPPTAVFVCAGGKFLRQRREPPTVKGVVCPKPDAMKIVLLCCAFLVVACSHHRAIFPTEAEVKTQLKEGMTREEVIALFGQPGARYTPVDDGTTTSSYLAPIATRTLQEEGYVGFVVVFENGRLREWRPIRANPSYVSGIQVPRQFKWTWLWWGALIAGGFIYGLIRAVQSLASEYKKLLRAYSTRHIPRWRLPPDFRFITHDTTLQEVIERAGEYSRIRELPVDEETVAGYAAAETKPGTPAIVTFEYDLPYRAAVILMPEYPFGPENRIRAVFYRPPRDDDDLS